MILVEFLYMQYAWYILIGDGVTMGLWSLSRLYIGQFIGLPVRFFLKEAQLWVIPGSPFRTAFPFWGKKLPRN